MSYLQINDNYNFSDNLIKTDNSNTKSDTVYFPRSAMERLNLSHSDRGFKKILTHSVSVIRKSATSYVWQELSSIQANRNYKDELLQKRHLLVNVDESTYNKAYNYFINEIVSLQPNNLHIKLTASDSIYFKFELDTSYIIRLEVFLDDEEVFSDTHENTSLIIDRSNVQEYGYFGSATNALKKLKTYLSSENVSLMKDSSTVEEDHLLTS